MAERKRRSGCLLAVVAFLLLGIGGVILLGLVGIVAGGGAAFFLMGRSLDNTFEQVAAEIDDAVVAPTETLAEIETVDVDEDTEAEAPAEAEVAPETPAAPTTPATSSSGTASATASSSSGSSSGAAPTSSSSGRGTTSSGTSGSSTASSGSGSSSSSSGSGAAPTTSSSGRGVSSPPPTERSGSTGGDVKVDVEGDAKVVLLRSGRRFTVPGKVPAGRYDIEATFPEQSPLVVAKITVREDTPMTIACNSRMGICRAR